MTSHSHQWTSLFSSSLKKSSVSLAVRQGSKTLNMQKTGNCLRVLLRSWKCWISCAETSIYSQARASNFSATVQPIWRKRKKWRRKVFRTSTSKLASHRSIQICSITTNWTRSSWRTFKTPTIWSVALCLKCSRRYSRTAHSFFHSKRDCSFSSLFRSLDQSTWTEAYSSWSNSSNRN